MNIAIHFVRTKSNLILSNLYNTLSVHIPKEMLDNSNIGADGSCPQSSISGKTSGKVRFA